MQVIPLIFPPSATRQLQRMQAILSRSGDFVREFGEAVGRGQELFSEKLTEAMTAASGAFASGLKEAGRGLEASLDSVASQARAAVGQLEESLGAMQEAGRALADSARSLLDYREELKRDRLELQALLRETNQSVLAIVERAVAPLERGGERIEQAAEALSQVKEQLIGDSRQHEAMVAAFLQQAERSAEERRADIVAFSQEAERDRTLLAEETGRGLVAAQEIRQAMERAGSSHVEAALRFQELAAAVRPEDLRLPNGQVLGDRLAEIAVGLEAMAERLRITESARLPDRLDAVATTLDRVATGLASLASHVATETDTRAQLVNLQRNTLAALRDVQHRMNQPLWRLLLPNGVHALGETA